MKYNCIPESALCLLNCAVLYFNKRSVLSRGVYYPTVRMFHWVVSSCVCKSCERRPLRGIRVFSTLV